MNRVTLLLGRVLSWPLPHRIALGAGLGFAAALAIVALG